MRSPLRVFGPEVTVKFALTLAPGASGPENCFAVSPVPATTAFHDGSGKVSSSLMADTGVAAVLVKVTVVSCDEPGENVCSPGGVAAAEAGAMRTAGRP